MLKSMWALLPGVGGLVMPGVAFAQKVPATAAQPTVGQSAVPANSGLDDIIVAATKTGETAAQRTPLAMSVFSADLGFALGCSTPRQECHQNPLSHRHHCQWRRAGRVSRRTPHDRAATHPDLVGKGVVRSRWVTPYLKVLRAEPPLVPIV